jgi:hypothetical protein
MKYFYILLILISTASLTSAQNRFGSTNGVDEIIMSGHDYIQFDQNSKKLFWAVDLNIFNADQKSSFQEFVFDSDILVACSVPDQNNYWYLSSLKTFDVAVVTTELQKLIDKAKALQLNSNDKYK